MTDPNNNWRAEKADTGLTAYNRAYYSVGAEDDETVLGDFLCDLRHYCDAKGFDFHAMVNKSYGMYAEEVQIDGGPATQVGDDNELG